MKLSELLAKEKEKSGSQTTIAGKINSIGSKGAIVGLVGAGIGFGGSRMIGASMIKTIILTSICAVAAYVGYKQVSS